MEWSSTGRALPWHTGLRSFFNSSASSPSIVLRREGTGLQFRTKKFKNSVGLRGVRISKFGFRVMRCHGTCPFPHLVATISPFLRWTSNGHSAQFLKVKKSATCLAGNSFSHSAWKSRARLKASSDPGTGTIESLGFGEGSVIRLGDDRDPEPDIGSWGVDKGPKWIPILNRRQILFS